MMTQNLWNTAKTILKGKIITIQSYFKKLDKYQINNLNLHLKKLEKEQQEKKTPQLEDIIRITAKVNEI